MVARHEFYIFLELLSVTLWHKLLLSLFLDFFNLLVSLEKVRAVELWSRHLWFLGTTLEVQVKNEVFVEDFGFDHLQQLLAILVRF